MKTCVVLIASMNSSKEFERNQRSLCALLDAKKIKYEIVDGCEHVSLRNELFGLSEKRGVYPQLFSILNGKYEFIGDFQAVSELNEYCDVPLEILEKNNIQTLDMVLKGNMYIDRVKSDSLT